MNKKLFFITLLIAASVPFFVLAANPVPISATLPGTTAAGCGPGSTSGCNPGAFVNNLYLFALIIGGILALGAVVFGGMKYITAAGNPSGQHEGKEWIEGALLGLLLLAGAYLILNTVNPNLTSLDMPNLQSVNVAGTPPAGSTGGVPPGAGCQLGVCQPITGQGIACKNSASCTADPLEVAALNCVTQTTGQTLRVTEGYPPTGTHTDKCHNDGCCVDLTPGSYPAETCAQVQAIVNAAAQCGATVVNEYPACGGSNTTFTTANNIHIQACK